MSCSEGVSIVLDGMVLNLDAANARSYSGSGTNWLNLITSVSATAILTGSPTYSTNNLGILTFDGSTMYADTSKTLPSLSIGDTYTFETVAKRSATCSGQIIWGWQGFNGGILIVSDRFSATDWYSNGVGGWITVNTISPTTTLINTWYHIVSTFDAHGFSRLYVNGVNIVNTDVSGFTTSSGNVWYRSTTITFAGQSFAGYRFPGSVAFGRLYNRELTADEVLQNFNAIRGRYGL